MRIEYLRIADKDTLPNLTFDGPLRVGLISESKVSPDWMSQVTDWLYRSDVQYFCAWGQDCEEWHDCMDWSNLEACEYDVPDEQHVMTTWHADEPLEVMLQQLKRLAGFSFDGNTPLDNVLLLHVGNVDKPELVGQFMQVDEA